MNPPRLAAVMVTVTALPGATVLGDMPLRRHRPPPKQPGLSLPVLWLGHPSD